MAKSPTELIRDLTTQIEVLSERDATRRAELEGLKARVQLEQAERKDTDEKARNEVVQLRLELAEARQETALVKQLLLEHIKKTELADSRRWGPIVLVLGGIFSLATGLIVTLVKK